VAIFCNYATRLPRPGPPRAGSAPAATARAASASSSQRRLIAGGAADHRRRLAAQLRVRSQAPHGRLQRHRRGRVKAWLGRSREYPLQKKRHSFEKLREWAHLRPRTNTFGAVARVRNCVSRSIHNFFPGRGLPLHPHADHHGQRLRRGRARCSASRRSTWPTRPKVEGKSTTRQDFFGRPAYLTVSGQLEGEIFACALGKVYTFGPTFRAENSNTSRHLAEFWMVEPEMAFYELNRQHGPGRAFLKRIFRDVLEHCAEDMQFFNERIDKTTCSRRWRTIVDSVRALPYTEAVDILEKSADVRVPGRLGHRPAVRARALPDREALQGPVILYDYPRTIKPFYMR
jgi:asparaginyl-tRNA synthetase